MRCIQNGGGYDKLPAILEKKLGLNKEKYATQFVVQLKGCPCKCPYCYVTPDGVNGKHHDLSTYTLVRDFIESKLSTFHLMGGAPALYLDHWHDLLTQLTRKCKDYVFHSDFLLIEKDYTKELLASVTEPNAIYAVSIKGKDAKQFKELTGIKLDEERLKRNLQLIRESNLNYYLTFTGMTQEDVDEWIAKYGIAKEEKEFLTIIDLVDYDALK